MRKTGRRSVATVGGGENQGAPPPAESSSAAAVLAPESAPGVAQPRGVAGPEKAAVGAAAIGEAHHHRDPQLRNQGRGRSEPGVPSTRKTHTQSVPWFLGVCGRPGECLRVAAAARLQQETFLAQGCGGVVGKAGNAQPRVTGRSGEQRLVQKGTFSGVTGCSICASNTRDRRCLGVWRRCHHTTLYARQRFAHCPPPLPLVLPRPPYTASAMNLSSESSHVSILSRTVHRLLGAAECNADPGIIGTWHDSDAEDDVHEDGDEEDVTKGPIPLEHVVVSWYTGTGKPELVFEDELVVLDRSLMYGDVVKDPQDESQSGTGISISMTVDLQHVMTGKVVKGVDTRRLRYYRRFVEGNSIVWDDWLGVIDDVGWHRHRRGGLSQASCPFLRFVAFWTPVFDKVLLKFPNGSICMAVVEDELQSTTDWDRDSYFYSQRYSVGQVGTVRFKVRDEPHNLQQARWFRGGYEEGHTEGTVLAATDDSIVVHWKTYRHADKLPEGHELPPEPEDVITEYNEDIKFDSFAEHASFQLSDHVVFRDEEDAKAHGIDVRIGEEHLAKGDYDSGCMGSGKPSETRLNVRWQDNSISRGVLARNLYPYLNMDDQDVWPVGHGAPSGKTLGRVTFSFPSQTFVGVYLLCSGFITCQLDFVVRKGDDIADPDPQAVKQTGLVQSVNSAHRTCVVKWFAKTEYKLLVGFMPLISGMPTIAGGPFLLAFPKEPAEELSFYEVAAHEYFQFRLYDRVLVADTPYQCPSDWAVPSSESQEPSEPVEGEFFNGRLGPDWRNWTGEICDIHFDGTISVRFLSGVTARVPACRLVIVSDEDDEDDVSQASWETMSAEYEADGEAEEGEEQEGDDQDMEFPGDNEHVNGFADEVDEDVDMEEDAAVGFTVGEEIQARGTDSAEHEEPKPPASVDVSNGLTPFKMLEEAPQEHQFYNNTIKKLTVSLRRLRHAFKPSPAYVKRVNKEFAILEGNLPPGIFVRVFEDRVDLLRVLISGPEKTP
ncbi:MAG: hypothetical protein BJ554DRAFT_5703 [Olpidium bornovanus]|uniref:UBC core domain-containing protein n=1 Tax=Olpidium bornovanus TaxID=278681 RepID=A0A8H7ZZ80_9FUNG|nr:MAG: hypothetical protein BJ554DRAFT_5703 [Olpidium bornovanus]